MDLPTDYRFINRIGHIYGRLTVCSYVGRTTDKLHHMWECLCKCGNKTKVHGCNLATGHIKSCGCLKRETDKRPKSHGKSKESLFKVWASMKNRCSHPHSFHRKHYGARGIKVCERWMSYQNFRDDMHPRPPGHQIDRIDNNGDYSPENCRWVTSKQNARNTRHNRMLTHDGKTLCMEEWAEITGFASRTIQTRLNKGWDVSKALTFPIRKDSRNAHKYI